MTERQFVWWLRGYMSQDTKKLNEDQVQLVKKQLTRVEPPAGEPKREACDQQKVDVFTVYS